MAILYSIPLILLTLGSAIAHGHGLHRRLREADVIPCGTEDSGAAGRAAHARAFEFRKFKASKLGKKENLFASSEETVIPVCIHAPTAIFHWLVGHHISKMEIQAQLDHLNNAFSEGSCCDSSLSWCDGECSVETNIHFELAKMDESGALTGETTADASDRSACITRRHSIMGRWTKMSPGTDKERRIMSALRKGDSSVLNVYFINPNNRILGSLLGYARYPWQYTNDPDVDGVVIRPSTITGGALSWRGKGEGDVLVHEVG
jgi:hypothetical protein